MDNSINILEVILRRFVDEEMHNAFGSSYIEKLGIAEERIEVWKRSQIEEKKLRKSVIVSNNLLDYSNLTDIESIILKNWNIFIKCFKNKKEFELYFKKLITYRNPDAHSRPLMKHEEMLLVGISQEFRHQIAIYKQETRVDISKHFAIIENITDSFGNSASTRNEPYPLVSTELVLHPGDIVTFKGEAIDPDDDEIEWTISSIIRSRAVAVGKNIEYEWVISESDIGEASQIQFSIKSKNKQSHRRGVNDGHAIFTYHVLPLK